MNEREVVEGLLQTGKWSEEAARRGIRTGFRCEYCDRDLLASPEAYRDWQLDHIVPRVSGGVELEENFAVACRSCNINWKARWDPRTSAGEQATREQLVAACRQRVAEEKARVRAEVDRVRAIVGRPPLRAAEQGVAPDDRPRTAARG